METRRVGSGGEGHAEDPTDRLEVLIDEVVPVVVQAMPAIPDAGVLLRGAGELVDGVDRGLDDAGHGSALGLASVVVVGAVGTYNAAREAANRSETLVLLNRIRANIEAAFAGAPSYGNNADLVAALDRRGGIPDSARTIGAGDKAEIRHPFGGLVTVTGGPGGITNRFRIQFADVDNEICAALGDAYAGRSRARAGVISITINGAALTSPVTAAQITAACDDGDGANDIGFIFG